MRFYEFTKEIEKEMATYFTDSVRIQVSTIHKNNGVKMEGLIIRENGQRVAPTIYLNCFYERFLQGMEIGEIGKEIFNIYQSCKNHPIEDAGFFADYEQVKNRVVYKLIHRECNRELLEDVPYIPYLDLAIVFYCIIYSEEYGNATVLVHNAHIQMWHVTAQQLYEHASRNTPVLLPYFMKSLNEVMEEGFEKMTFAYDNDTSENTMDMVKAGAENFSMYVLTNQAKLFGAAAILYPDLLKDFAAACGRDFYILPSSIHEVILVPEFESSDFSKLSDMVKEINGMSVAREEVLSDHAYYYDSEMEQIVME